MISNTIINEVGQQGIKAIVKVVNTPETHTQISEFCQGIISAVIKGR